MGEVVVAFSFAVNAVAGTRRRTVFVGVARFSAVGAVLLALAIFCFMVIEHVTFVANVKSDNRFLGDLQGGYFEVK